MAKQGSIFDDAFFVLEARDLDRQARESRSLEEKNTRVANQTTMIISDDDVDFESDDMTPVKRRPSSSKRKRPSSGSSIRNDRRSMSLKTKRVEANEPTKRKLDFSSTLKYTSDNSELSGTDEDAYEEDERITKRKIPAEKPSRTRRPRESLMSNVTPQTTTRSKKAGKILESIDLESDDDDEVFEESVPASILNRTEPSSTSHKETFKSKKQLEAEDVSIAKKSSPLRKQHKKYPSILEDEHSSDSETFASTRTTRRTTRKVTSILDDDDDESEPDAVQPAKKKYPLKSRKRKSILDDENDSDYDAEIPIAKRKVSPAKLQVKSTIYPLPVLEPSPEPENSAKKRRIRKVVTSDDDDSEGEGSEKKKNAAPVVTIVLDHSPQRVRSAPSSSAKKIMESAKSKQGNPSNTDLEWYQERTIADFSDDDSTDSLLSRQLPKRKKKKAPGQAETSTRVPSISKYCAALESSSRPSSNKIATTGSNRKSVFIGNEEVSTEAQPIKRPRSPAARKRPVSNTRLTMKEPSIDDIDIIFVSPSSTKKTSLDSRKVITISPGSMKKNLNSRPSISIVGLEEEESIAVPKSSAKRKTKARPKLTVKNGGKAVEKNAFFKPKRRGSLLKNTKGNSQVKDVITIDSDNDDFESSDLLDVDEIEHVESSFDRDTPELAPFNLEELCLPGENLDAMMQRLGEDEVFSKIENAQTEGRKVVGAEHLGITSTQPTAGGGAEKLFREAWKGSGKKRRGSAYDPEDAMTGNYTFHYAGRDKEDSDEKPRTWKKRSWGRRGRGRGRGRGRAR